jgi:hypothetical protein
LKKISIGPTGATVLYSEGLIMKRVTVLVTACVMYVGLVAEISAQGRRPPAALPGEGPLAGEPVILDLTKPKNPTIILDTVEVVGCVSQAPDKKWAVTNATKPLKAGSSAQTAEGLKAAETKALGTGRYVLIGASGWNPPSHMGQKVAVRGFVIKDVSEYRINVVSFNKIADTCK